MVAQFVASLAVTWLVVLVNAYFDWGFSPSALLLGWLLSVAFTIWSERRKRRRALQRMVDDALETDTYDR